MESKKITIQTPLSPSELTGRLKSVSITDFDHLHDAPEAVYYGDIKSHSFDLKNVRYSPMSSIPSLKGDIVEGANMTVVKVDFDMAEQFNLSRKMYYATLMPLGVVFMLLTVAVMGGTEYQMEGILASLAFIMSSFVAVWLTRVSLLSARSREVKKLLTVIDGSLVAQPVAQRDHGMRIIPEYNFVRTVLVKLNIL
jgi:hypothetical protein